MPSQPEPVPVLSSTQRLLALRAPVHASLSPDGALLSLTTTSITAGTEDTVTRWSLIDIASGDEGPLPGADVGTGRGVWSPDGSTLAAITGTDGTASLVLVDPTGTLPTRTLDGASRVAGAPLWSPDGTSITVPCMRGVEVDRTRPYRWTRPSAAFDGMGPLEDPPQLRMIDVSTGDGTWMTDDGWRWAGVQWSPDGDRLAAVAGLDPNGLEFGQRLRIVGRDGAVTAPATPTCRVLRAVWLDDGRLVALLVGATDRPFGSASRLVVVDGEKVSAVAVTGDVELFGDVYGDSPAELTECPDYVLLADHGPAVIVRTGARGRMGIARVDVDSGAAELLVDGDRCASPIAVRRSTLVFSSQSCERPAEVAVLTGARHSQRRERNLTTFGPVAAGVTARRFVVASPDGPDGWPLDAWFLTSPDAPDGVALPTVLAIHGGPQAAFGESFSIDFHALCAAGFGVLYTNPRGSVGWGDEFAHAVIGDWADGPTRDVLAVVDHAVAQGWADGDRLGVTGLSYGGYLSAWLSSTTSRFRAAVIENPATDLASMWGASDIGFEFMAPQFGGAPYEAAEAYAAQSPLYRAHESRTPTLFVIGEIDHRCPAAQAWSMHRVLISVSTPSEVLVLPGASHEGSTYGPAAGRIAHDEALVDWMTRWVMVAGV